MLQLRRSTERFASCGSFPAVADIVIDVVLSVGQSHSTMWLRRRFLITEPGLIAEGLLASRQRRGDVFLHLPAISGSAIEEVGRVGRQFLQRIVAALTLFIFIMCTLGSLCRGVRSRSSLRLLIGSIAMTSRVPRTGVRSKITSVDCLKKNRNYRSLLVWPAIASEAPMTFRSILRSRVAS